ncbi:MAG: SDR family NAD(P)-dependent oxidoreductase, partial [Nocardioides sp.]|uniref:SDR family NAD(P)-dependent oxidoreductase n=1 Tax=Nocardioides sp. TaxID=35761 RepID=UPI003F0CBB64
ILIADLEPAAADVAAAQREEFGADVRHAAVDITVEDDVRTMVATCVDAWGGIDILVNNAWAGAHVGRLENKTAEHFERSFALGFHGPFWAMREAYAHMAAAGYGRIVNVCTLNGVMALRGTLDYNAAKEALRTLTRSAAREWAADGVVVNAICPAAKSTGFTKMMAEHPELEAAADASNPMGRIGDCEHDIGPVVAFLASDDCQYVTGNTVFVDGGAHINGVQWDPGHED